MLKQGRVMLKELALVPAVLVIGLSGLSTAAQAQNDSAWQQILNEAKGQSVYFNAWGGSDTINDYIAWAAAEVKKQYQVDVKQVKITDTGDVVSRILAEKSANREIRR